MPDNPAVTIDPNEQMISAILNQARGGAPVQTQDSPLPTQLQNPNPQQPPEAPDFGTGVPGNPPQVMMQPDQQQPSGPPKQSNVPALYGFMKQMFGGQNQRGYQDAPPGQPGRPVSRLDAFENFLGNFLNSFSQGMANSGQGPAANARGFGAAVQAPYQRQLQQYQMGQQAQAQQSQIGLQQAEAERQRAQAAGVTVTLPNGQVATLPAEYAKSIMQSQIAAQGKVQAAGVKRFQMGPFGILDTQTGKLAGGTSGGMAATATVTPEMVEKYPEIPKEFIGKQIKNSDLIGYMNAESRNLTVAQGAGGPAVVRKYLAPGQNVQSLGLGSPAANWLAQDKQKLARDKYGDVLNALSPGAQKVMEETVPVHQQIQDLMKQFEGMKDDNTPGKFFVARAEYAAGIHSDIGEAADTIAQLELNKVQGAARVMKGGSKAFQALNLAMQHLPNVWLDSPQQIYSKLNNLHGALGQIEDAAQKYGKKSGLVDTPSQTETNKPKNSALTEAEALQYLQRAGGNKDTARKLAKADGRSF